VSIPVTSVTWTQWVLGALHAVLFVIEEAQVVVCMKVTRQIFSLPSLRFRRDRLQWFVGLHCSIAIAEGMRPLRRRRIARNS
jgi:hypothetical protein